MRLPAEFPSPIFKSPPEIVSDELFMLKSPVIVVEPEVWVNFPDEFLFIPTSAKLPPETFVVPLQVSVLSKATFPPEILSVPFCAIFVFAPCSILPAETSNCPEVVPLPIFKLPLEMESDELFKLKPVPETVVVPLV